ncbi:MAG: DUF748 domain-containing protein [Candidatus Omnitrophica bacterium]|nr:DUF748 domain-containing protein [Candidatus Omnitrophota bacterium]
MKRPRVWIRALVLGCGALLLGEYIALTVLAPRYVLRAIRQLAGGAVSVGRVRLSLPFTSTLSHLRLRTNTEERAFAIQRATVVPRRFSIPTKTLWIDAVTIDQPVIRATRTREGAWRWPSVSPPGGALPAPAGWQLSIDSLHIVDGSLIFVDEQPAKPFHGMIDHLSLSAGPITAPLRDLPISFAVRGELAGDAGHAAPFYCSGWIAPVAGDLQGSCQLEPLPMAALESYLRGPRRIRVYGTTLQITSQWSAAGNVLQAKVQLELGHLTGEDFSVSGRTIFDVKQFGRNREFSLRGEINLIGPMEQPQAWHAEFVAGDDQVQSMTNRLLDRGVEIVQLPLWGHRLNLSLVPATEATMTEIEATSKQIKEALEVLAMPAEEPSQAPVELPSVPAIDDAVLVPPPSAPSPPTAPSSPAPSPDTSAGQLPDGA